jgi:hypothetical protein
MSPAPSRRAFNESGAGGVGEGDAAFPRGDANLQTVTVIVTADRHQDPGTALRQDRGGRRLGPRARRPTIPKANTESLRL